MSQLQIKLPFLVLLLILFVAPHSLLYAARLQQVEKRLQGFQHSLKRATTKSQRLKILSQARGYVFHLKPSPTGKDVEYLTGLQLAFSDMDPKILRKQGCSRLRRNFMLNHNPMARPIQQMPRYYRPSLLVLNSVCP